MQMHLRDLYFLVEYFHMIEGAANPIGGDRVSHLHHARVPFRFQKFHLQTTIVHYNLRDVKSRHRTGGAVANNKICLSLYSAILVIAI